MGDSDVQTGLRNALGHHLAVLDRVKALRWSAVESGVRQVLSLVFFLVTVRFLHPSDLGVFSLGVAITAILGIFIDEPIGESLVQKPMVTEADWDTGFTINLIGALGFFLLTVIAGGIAATFLQDTKLLFVIAALSGSSVAGAFGNIQKAFLSRNLRFRTIAKTALLSQMASGIASIGMAVCGLGYWALVAGVVVAAVTTSTIYWRTSPWKPRLQINPEAVRAGASYVAQVVVIRSIYLFRDQSPVFIAGLFVDLTRVGYFSLALRVGRSLGQIFEEVGARPLLSMISREQHNQRQFNNTMLDVLTVMLALALPVFIALSQVGDVLIILVFGPAWKPTGDYLPFVCIFLGGWLILHVVGVALRARGLGRTTVLLTAPAAILDVMILMALAPIGLEWALVGWAARALLALPIAGLVLRYRLNIAWRELAGRLAGPSMASAMMILSAHCFDAFAIFGYGPGARLASATLSGLIYGGVLLAMMLLQCPLSRLVPAERR
jgi:O-antigen/teichoic acid export membrane protein